MPSAPTPPGSGSVFKKILTIGFALVGIGLILWLDSWFMDHAGMPDLNGDLNFGLLFLIGFLTSFHCVGMCGPLILGYIAKSAKAGQHSHTAHLLYGAGKTVSYASIGALFGAFGAMVAFTPFTQGVIGVAAGFFLILFGIHMLEIFPALHHFQFKTPAFVMRFVGKEYRKHSNPFVIGLLNGLMIICGPLQAMYVMAAGSGSWSQGAAILLFFGLGTLPLLMGFGVLTSLLSANLTPKLLKASGVIVIALGVIMLNRGLSVTGSGADFNTLLARLSLEFAPTSAQTQSCENEQTIRMEVLENRFSPNKFTLRKGVPVKWVIDVKELNQCNKEIVVRDYGLEIQLRQGAQVVEFTPPEAGVVAWSCWMGMIPGTFIVVDDVKPAVPDTASPAAVDAGETVLQRLLHLFRERWQKILR
ncbi:sulfite exporter TauE/SafE family protein [Methylomonas koyamae]|uniref:sulfite exporter TauE/SafE family protein n=1 Tax=Methylomonas koyamae TaxID=702114 RepID=UPI0021B2EE28|nr:sulfite exporter TauE/SafE family protein [Methylomonas koyamae]